MREIYILILFAFAFGFGLLLAKHHYEPTTAEVNQKFYDYGQYTGKYMNYTDVQMLEACDKHDLIYDYEDGQCKF